MCYFAVPCRAQRGTCCPAGLQTGAPRQGLPRGRGSQGKSIKPPDLQQLQDTRPSLQNLRNRIKNSQAGMIFIIIFLFVLHCAPTTAWGVISPSIPPRSPTVGKGRGGWRRRREGKGRREGKEGRQGGGSRHRRRLSHGCRGMWQREAGVGWGWVRAEGGRRRRQGIPPPAAAGPGPGRRWRRAQHQAQVPGPVRGLDPGPGPRPRRRPRSP